MNKLSTITLNLKRFVLSVALLLTSISLVAQPEQTDELRALKEMAEMRFVQLVIVGLLSLVIIGLLIGLLVYRHQKNLRMREQFQQLQQAIRNIESSQAIRRAFVTTIQEKLQSPVNVLRGYALVFNNSNFLLKPEERPKRYYDILTAARTIESLMDPLLEFYARGTTGITDEERQICIEALRTPLLTLIGTTEVIIDGHGKIPHEEYMQLRSTVCRGAYHVATSTHQLLLFSLYGDDIPTPKNDRIGLNEVTQSILGSYDLHPSAVDQHRILDTEFKTEVSDDVIINTSQLLQELLVCLIDNADKYATGGTILVTCHQDAGGTYAISVANDGPTIPAADAERIFEPFVRLTASERSLGIGLPLARRLALSMGYKVSLDVNYTRGARFIVSGL